MKLIARCAVTAKPKIAVSPSEAGSSLSGSSGATSTAEVAAVANSGGEARSAGFGRFERRHRTHGPLRLRYVRGVGVWCVCVRPRVSERAGRDRSGERLCQDKAIQDDSEKHAQVFTWRFGSLRISHQRGGETDSCNVVSNVR